jgi:hypothetical protein
MIVRSHDGKDIDGSTRTPKGTDYRIDETCVGNMTGHNLWKAHQDLKELRAHKLKWKERSIHCICGWDGLTGNWADHVRGNGREIGQPLQRADMASGVSYR